MVGLGWGWGRAGPGLEGGWRIELTPSPLPVFPAVASVPGSVKQPRKERGDWVERRYSLRWTLLGEGKQ